MEYNELLKAISEMMDQKLEPIKSELQSLKEEQTEIKSELQSLKEEQSEMKSELQMQIKRTERNLKSEIIDSENLILDEVSRVHRILNEHKADTTKHIA